MVGLDMSEIDTLDRFEFGWDSIYLVFELCFWLLQKTRINCAIASFRRVVTFVL